MERVRSLGLAFLRAVQLAAMLSVLGGLYIGYQNRDMTFELMTLGVGAVVFYLTTLLRERWMS